jgi:glycosyltransferase involved in cell wall biosynthesis
MNPNLQAEAPFHFPPILEAVITHLPNQDEYHGVRLEVIQTCLKSMRKFDGHDYPVMIWDNGSCSDLTDWLRNVYKPDYLILSPNVGKSSARAAIMHMLPPETIVAISDDDMLFYPKWLDPQIEILNTYPNVGMVSGWPVRRSMGISNEHTLAWARGTGKLQTGRFISDKEEADYAYSIGNKYESIRDMFLTQSDYMVEYQGIKAYCTAQHCQFVARAGVIAPFCLYDKKCMNTERPFDKSIDDAGLLRLTTIERLTRHIGNILDDKIRLEIGATL